MSIFLEFNRLLKEETQFLPATEENIERAKVFIWEKWKERAREMGRPEPEDLSSACKFASIFATMVFGGEARGNWHHQFAQLDKQLIDLTAGRSKYASGDYYHHDRKFWRNPEHRESMASCEPRVRKWAEEFLRSEITEAMDPQQALQVFKKYGVDARGMDKQALRKARSRITMKGGVHPEKGGSHDLMQELNQAVDALVAQPQKRPQKPQAGFQDFGDYMKGQGKAPPKKGGFEPFQGAKVYRDVANFRPGRVWKA